jgi:proteasome regulatory subunit
VCSYSPDLQIKEGDVVALHQRSMAIIEVLPQLTDPLVTAMELIDKPTENYDDIGGLTEQITEIREVIELPFKDPEAFKIFNITPPKGVLLFGPPGTGKTLIAKAVANATNAKFIRLAAPELVQKFIGEGARLVREIFRVARENAPAVIFIDEIDAIAAKRTDEGQSGEREVNRTLMQLLAEMDGFSKNNKIPIIAATNRIDILDPAILRPGRFDRIINLPLPNPMARKSIFQIHMKNLPVNNLNFEEILEKTEGMSGADIHAVCLEAGMFALRDRLKGKNRTKVLQKDFLSAINKVKNKINESSNCLTTQARNLYS